MGWFYLWFLDTDLKINLTPKKFCRLAVVAEYNLLFSLQRVYSQILRVGKLLFAFWKETGCAYLWMKGLAWTLHRNKDHDPIWLPRHMVLFLRQRESVADSHLGRPDWISGRCMKAEHVKSHEHTRGFIGETLKIIIMMIIIIIIQPLAPLNYQPNCALYSCGSVI